MMILVHIAQLRGTECSNVSVSYAQPDELTEIDMTIMMPSLLRLLVFT